MLSLGRKLTYLRPALLFGTALSLAPGAAQAAEEARGLENIVVTAQRREENLQSVPVAVTALTRQSLEDIHFRNISDLHAVAPGVSLREGAGGTQTQQFTMRGVYGVSTFASDGGIALYVDGVYIASTIGSEFDLADVERIEVLRGPQGTLFGRNAIGGAVSIITKEPTGEFHAHQQFAVGNRSQFRSKTSIDLPAWGLLSASVSFLHDEADGDVKNLGAGTVWDYGPSTGGTFGLRKSPSTLGGHDTNAVSAAVKLETDSGIKAVYRFNYSHKDFTPDAIGIFDFPADGGPTASLLQAIYALNDTSNFTPISHTRPDALNNSFTTESLAKVHSHTLTVTAPVMEHVTVKNIFGYRYNYVDAANNLTGLGGLFTSNLAPLGLDFYPAGTPFIVIENATQSQQKTVSDELQFNADTKWVNATLGYLYYHSKGDEGGFGHQPSTVVFAGLSGPPWFNFTRPPSTDAIRPEHNLIRTTSHAVYSHNEVHITDKLDVVGGIRYTKDTRHGIDGSPTPGADATTVRYSKGTWTYLAGLNYKVSDDIFAYAKYSTAYISGGQLANLTFDPETAKSWEAGIKADLFDNTMRLNLALFTVKYNKVQTLTSPQVSNGGCSNFPNVSRTAGQCLINGGNAKASGFELEGTYVTPIDGVTLAGNVSYNDFHYTSVDPGLRSPIDGSFVPQQTPQWTGSISVAYRGPDMDALHGAHFGGRIEGNYSSSAYAQANSSMAALQAALIPSRWLLNGRVGINGFEVGGVSVDLNVYGRNLTDNKSETYAAMFGFVSAGTYQRARSFGVELDADF
jgi:iron complex outermembrane receptor protein